MIAIELRVFLFFFRAPYGKRGWCIVDGRQNREKWTEKNSSRKIFVRYFSDTVSLKDFVKVSDRQVFALIQKTLLSEPLPRRV